MTQKHTKTQPYSHSSVDFNPDPKNIFSKTISYCYPTSTRAEYFNAGATGGYFVAFNGDNAHTGIFKTLEEAEKYCDERYPIAEYGYYSKRSNASIEKWRQSLPSAMQHAKGEI